MRDWVYLPQISEDEFTAHIEDGDFYCKYGNPVVIHSKEHGELVCMSYAYYERLHNKIEELQGALPVSGNSSGQNEMAAPPILFEDSDESIKYWIYEFQMPEPYKKKLQQRAASLEMTMNEYIEAMLAHALEHPETSQDAASAINGLKPNPQVDSDLLGINLVRIYPVYQGETEAQALKRAREEEQRNTLEGKEHV